MIPAEESTENPLSVARTDHAHQPAPQPLALVARELELVEQRLSELLRSREARLTDISTYLIDAGGKRARPAITLLVFRACGGKNLTDAIDIAVALELIHSASLLHDDIIDDSSTRRGRDSALQRWGIADTLVAGDFLFSRAYQICGRFDATVIDWAAEACIALTEGEIMQARFRRNATVTVADYLEIIHRKTASLFEQTSRIAAYLAAADKDVVEAMARCGTHVGLTFQMVDDILDVTAIESQLGKPVGIDLREGNPSLPIVLALEEDPQLSALFEKQSLTELEVTALIERLQSPAIVERGLRMAAEHAAVARDALTLVPDSAYRQGLLSLIDQLLDRAA